MPSLQEIADISSFSSHNDVFIQNEYQTQKQWKMSMFQIFPDLLSDLVRWKYVKCAIHQTMSYSVEIEHPNGFKSVKYNFLKLDRRHQLLSWCYSWILWPFHIMLIRGAFRTQTNM